MNERLDVREGVLMTIADDKPYADYKPYADELKCSFGLLQGGETEHQKGTVKLYQRDFRHLQYFRHLFPTLLQKGLWAPRLFFLVFHGAIMLHVTEHGVVISVVPSGFL